MVNQITGQYAQVYDVKQNVPSQKKQAKDSFQSILDNASHTPKSAQAPGKDKSEDIKPGPGKDSNSDVKNKQAGVQGQTQSAAVNTDVSAQTQTAQTASVQSQASSGSESVPHPQDTSGKAAAVLSVAVQGNSKDAVQAKNNATAINGLQNTAQQKQPVAAESITKETSSQTMQKAQASTENAKTSNFQGQLKQDVSASGTVQQENKTGFASTNAAKQLSQNTVAEQAVDIKSAQETGGEGSSGGGTSGSGGSGGPFSLKSAKPGSNNGSTDISQLSTSARQSANLYTDGNIVVKVSDAPAKIKVPAYRQVADSIATNFNGGRHELQISLYPQSLGKVSVKLTSESGMLTVIIAASNPKTQSLLAANSGDIKSILQSSTGQQNVQIVNHSRQDSGAWHDGNHQGGGYGGSRDDNRQQQHQNGQNRHIQEIYGINGAGLSTGDFLTMISSAASGQF